MAESSPSSSASSSPADAWRRIGEAVGTADAPPALAEKVRLHAWRIVDADVAGMTADELYEAVLPVAFTTADERLRAALEAIDAG